jgi:DNA-nicking Smr family endonuclease
MPRRDLPSRPLSEEERHLWQQITAEVQPLHAPLKATTPAPMLPRRPMLHPAAVPLPLRPVPPPQEAIDPQMKRRLRRGVLTPEARLDLHGLNTEAAFAQLAQFIERCARTDKRFVLVITGKGPEGRGKLREAFPRWLDVAPLSQLVQAFEPAQPRDGGSGAFYVKLRRLKD